MPIMDYRHSNSTPKNLLRGRVARRPGNADMLQMETTTPVWEPSDQAMVRLAKLLGNLRRTQTRWEEMEALVRAAQAIEAARQKNEISDQDAQSSTQFLIDFAVMQPAYERASSTIEDYITRHLQPSLPQSF